MGNTKAATGDIGDKEKREIIRQWFEDNYSQLRINVLKICGGEQHVMEKWGKDLLPYFIEGFLKRPIERQYEIFTDGKFENYCTRGMSMALKSSTSMFYQHYRKKGRALREFYYNHDYGLYEDNATENREKNIDIVKEVVAELDFYDRYIISKYYFEDMNLQEINEITNIPNNTLSADIKKALKKLKLKLIEKDIIL